MHVCVRTKAERESGTKPRIGHMIITHYVIQCSLKKPRNPAKEARLGMSPICSKIYLFCFFRTAFKYYLFCSQTAPILLGIMLGVARQIFKTQLLAASATKEVSTGHCQRFIGKLSNSLSRSHTLWLSRSSSLAATRSLSFRRRIRSDLTFPGESQRA